ncbi:MAG TPA: hypothetical protein VKA37_11610 [Halobacteriales archaeon]|nr:hypothetical protein [Halobacteriales archaeon]
MPTTATRTDRSAFPSFETIASQVDRLGELAERELPAPASIEVRGWDDGDFSAVAYHRRGTSPREVIKYVEEKESFVYRYVEQDGEVVDVLEERVLEPFPVPN